MKFGRQQRNTLLGEAASKGLKVMPLLRTSCQEDFKTSNCKALYLSHRRGLPAPKKLPCDPPQGYSLQKAPAVGSLRSTEAARGQRQAGWGWACGPVRREATGQQCLNSGAAKQTSARRRAEACKLGVS